MIPVCRLALGDEELRAIERVLQSGQLVQASEVRRFEERIAAIAGVRHAVAVSSGTAALHLAFIALGVSSGDEVIVPDLTFPAPALAALQLGATPVLLDVDADRFALSAESVEAAITPRTRCICVIHQFGIATPMRELLAVAGRHELPIVEDAACALGATSDLGRCGALGHIGCFSFHPRKIVTTGEGGALTTNDSALAVRLRSLRSHGRDEAGSFDFVRVGLNYRLSELHAAIGNVQLTHFEQMVAARRSAFGRYRERLSELPLRVPAGFSDPAAVVQSLVVELPAGCDRERARQLLEELGVQTTIASVAQHEMSAIRNRARFDEAALPISSRIASYGLTLPLFPEITDEQIEQVCSALAVAIERASTHSERTSTR